MQQMDHQAVQTAGDVSAQLARLARERRRGELLALWLTPLVGPGAFSLCLSILVGLGAQSEGREAVASHYGLAYQSILIGSLSLSSVALLLAIAAITVRVHRTEPAKGESLHETIILFSILETGRGLALALTSQMAMNSFPSQGAPDTGQQWSMAPWVVTQHGSNSILVAIYLAWMWHVLKAIAAPARHSAAD